MTQLPPGERTVDELSSAVFTGQLVDQNGVAVDANGNPTIVAAQINAATLTLYDRASYELAKTAGENMTLDGTWIVNGRYRQNVLNANGVTIADGLDENGKHAVILTWTMSPADNALFGTDSEAHIAVFEYQWNSGNQKCVQSFRFDVKAIAGAY